MSLTIGQVEAVRFDLGDELWNNEAMIRSGFNPTGLFGKDLENYNRALDNTLAGDATLAEGTVQKAFLYATVKEVRLPDSDDLADGVLGHLLSDQDRFFPDRPGLVPPTRPGGPIDLEKNTFKEDSPDRVAILTVVKPIDVVDPALPRPFKTLYRTNHFLLQQVGESFHEKAQLVETFGEPIIYFFGERARVFQYSGVLMNTGNFSWRNEWLRVYETYLRGTRAVENRARVYLVYEDIMRGGYLLNTSLFRSRNAWVAATVARTSCSTRSHELSVL